MCSYVGDICVWRGGGECGCACVGLVVSKSVLLCMRWVGVSICVGGRMWDIEMSRACILESLKLHTKMYIN